MKSILIILGLFFYTIPSFAGALVALQNQEVSAPVNEELGSIFQLPSAVNTVTPSKYFQISDVGSSTDPSTGLKTDVRTFQIKAVRGAKSEIVTFVLAGGKNISIKFIPAADADKFYDVHFESPRKQSKSFFNQELQMMQSMILDEGGGYAREIFEKKIETKFDDFSFVMTRVYASNDFTGYVFEIKNKSKEPKKINLSHFSFGYPNKAVLAHVVDDEITSCPFFGSDKDCATRLQVVVRGNSKQPVSILSSSDPIPFMNKNLNAVDSQKIGGMQ